MISARTVRLARRPGGLRRTGIWLLAAGAAVVLSGGVAAAVSHAAGAIHGCEAHSGVLSIRKGSSCPRGDKAISWNRNGTKGKPGRKGARGARGAPGPAGPSSTMFSQPGSAGFNSNDGEVPLATLPLQANADYLVNFTADASSDVSAALELKCTIQASSGSKIDGDENDTDTYADLPVTEQLSDIAITATAAAGSAGGNLQLFCEQTTSNSSSAVTLTMGSIELTATQVGSLTMVTP